MRTNQYTTQFMQLPQAHFNMYVCGGRGVLIISSNILSLYPIWSYGSFILIIYKIILLIQIITQVSIIAEFSQQVSLL